MNLKDFPAQTAGALIGVIAGVWWAAGRLSAPIPLSSLGTISRLAYVGSASDIIAFQCSVSGFYLNVNATAWKQISIGPLNITRKVDGKWAFDWQQAGLCKVYIRLNMAPVYKIALIQLNPRPLDCAGNFSKAESFIRSAASQGATLAVLPEYHLTNWLPDDPKFPSACSAWKEYLRKYQDLAAELSICIVPGTIIERHEEAESEEDRYENSAYFIDDRGEILGRYQKKNLWHPERALLTSSAHNPHDVFDTPLGKVGLLICWDLAFPEAFRELIGQGAKIIIMPTFWTLTDCSKYGLKLNAKSEALFLQSTVVARAFENTCAVIFVNAGESASTKSPGNYAGLSQLALPFIGGVGNETKDTAVEGMSIEQLDMELLEEAEKQYKVRHDMARDDWHYSYRHDRADRRENSAERESKI